MKNSTKLANSVDDTNWFERGNFWSEQLNYKKHPRGRKPRFLHEPLILGGHGLSLRVDHGTLLIREGFTHYPQELKEYRFFPKDRRLPSQIIIIESDGRITLDAIKWLSEQNVPLIQINWRGELINVAGNYGYSADPKLVKRQIEIQNSDKRQKFANWLISEKIKNSIETIEYVFPPSFITISVIKRLKLIRAEIKNKPPKSIGALLNFEGQAAAAYFRCWHNYPIKWKGLGKKPIPKQWHHIGARMATRQRNQFARHPVNAILNYAYGILENRVRAAILAAGYNPLMGFLHTNIKKDKSLLVFDLMEPMRPIIDLAIIEFLKQQTFSPADFILEKNGVCKLHPQFAKNIIKLAENKVEIELTTKKLLENLKQ